MFTWPLLNINAWDCLVNHKNIRRKFVMEYQVYLISSLFHHSKCSCLCLRIIWPSWFLVELEFGNVVFGERGKPEYPEKNLSEKRREPTTNSTHMRRRRWDLNPGQINGRRVLSPLRHPLLPKEGENRLGSVAKLDESISPSNIKLRITPLLTLIFFSDVKLVYLWCKLIDFFHHKSETKLLQLLVKAVEMRV